MSETPKTLETTEASRLDEVDFVENPEPRCPCVLLLDTSASMQGEKIASLNAGLATFKAAVTEDPMAALRVEVAVVTFDSAVHVAKEFGGVRDFEPPVLTAGGATHMGAGIVRALELVEARKARYKAEGLMYYRPWIFMITDGEPQGEAGHVVQDAARRLKEAETKRRVAFFAVAVDSSNMARLSELCHRPPVRLRGLSFQEMFAWLSTSMVAVAQSRPESDVQVALPVPGWTNP